MELKWTSKALSDLARLYDFLVLASKPAAARTVQSLTQAPVILLTHPRMGEQLFQFEPREVRRIFAGEYEIRYELNGQTIYVLRLWHTRKRLVRTVLIFTESSDQLSRATDRVPGLPASPGYVQ